MKRVLQVVLAAVVLGGSAVAASAASSSKAGFQIKNGPTWSIPTGGTQYIFAGGDNKSFRACGANRTLAIGWAGNAPVVRATGYQGESIDKEALLAVHRGHTDTKVRPIVVCGTRMAPGRTMVGSKGPSIKCPVGFTGLGLYRSGFGYQATAILSEPLGAAGGRGWLYDANVSGPMVQCVKRTSFKAMSKVKRTATLQPGQVTGTVAAVCPRGQRAITWGTGISPSPLNRFQSVSAPYITSIVPTSNSWRLTVTTPDNLPAKEATSFSVTAVCGAPGNAYVPPKKKK